MQKIKTSEPISREATLQRVVESSKDILALVASAAILLCLVSVLTHYVFSIYQPVRWPTKFYFFLFFFIALISQRWAVFCLIFSLPLLPELHIQAEYIFQPKVKYFVNYAGVDVVVGTSLGLLVRRVFIEKVALINLWRPLPWPINILIVMLFISSFIAIARNLFRSGLPFNVFDLVQSAIQFKLLQRIDPYFPAVEFIIYGICGFLIYYLLPILRQSPNRDQLILKPVLAGLFIASLLGIFQALTSYGLHGNTWTYRPESFGYGAQAFQPDIHAFAAHMLVGTVGLFAYVVKERSAQKVSFFTALVWILCWIALVLSKSRASLIFALLANAILLACLVLNSKIKVWTIIATSCLAIVSVITLAYATNNLYWILDALKVLISIENADWERLNQLSRDRLDIHSAALRMGWAFPLFGLGLGLFFPLSAIEKFSNSPYLVKMQGENAHNYFLQMFAEVGLVGIGCFILVFVYPLIQQKNRQILYPSVVLITASFLGNLYSHSLIIRENLLLLSVFAALMYSQINYTKSFYFKNKLNFKQKRFIIIFIVLAVPITYIFYLIVNEIYYSFGRFPFYFEKVTFEQYRKPFS
ncbi:O-antigen ligase-related [Burkholderiaceae bacterium]